MKAVKLDYRYENSLKKFCDECLSVGYVNNASLDAMKWGGSTDLIEPPDFWGLIIDDEIVSVSGCHRFGVHSPGIIQIRCLFRSATLPRFQSLIPGISKNHMNSIPFSILLPYQLLYNFEKGHYKFYITTSNGEHDASGKMKRTHKVMEHLAKKQLVDFVSEDMIYSTKQTKWKIKFMNYYNALMKFRPTKEKLGFIDDFDYDKFFQFVNQYKDKN
jgi:hypothetical protein